MNRKMTRTVAEHTFTLVLAAAALSLAPVPGARAAGTWHERIRVGVGLRATHDDNFLQYSDGQIAVFDAGTNPDRYSITSIDDALYEPSVSLAYESDRGRRGGRTIRARWSGEFHGTNATADHGAASLLWREEFGKDRGFSVGGYRLPNFYLRQLFDEDVPSGLGLSRYRRASFALTIGSVEYRQRIAPRTIGRLYYQYERRDYRTYFPERNSDTHETGLGGSWNPARSRFDLSGSAGYRTSLAAGRDDDDAAGATADDPDVSYHGLVLTGASRVALSRAAAGRLDGEVGYEFKTRDYTTHRASDASHFERKDLIADLTLALRWNPRGPLWFRAFFVHENDHASFSAVNPPATDPASYTANQVGASVEWGSTLWQR